MAKLPRHLLERSPEETARRLCLSLLGEAAQALQRIDDPGDDEGLHDFRVSLRRLRSLMRAYRAHLKGSRAKKLRARVKSLASSTNLARDAEVQIAWLTKEGSRLGDAERAGANHLLQILKAKQRTTPSTETLRREFSDLSKEVTRRLSRMRLRTDPEDTTFVAATADVVAEHAEILRESLAEAHSAEDLALLHRARIEAKRLRYILEPLQAELKEARPLIKRMKSLQDCLGDLQDTRVLTEEISNALEWSALEQARKLRDLALQAGELPEAYAPQDPGLLALLKVQRERRSQRFGDLEREWTGTTGRAFFGSVDRFVERLRAWPAHELPKRRFLLRNLPAPIRRRGGQLVREGWIPGKEIRERVRTTRTGRQVRYARVIESNGDGPHEERLTRRAFDELWALTAGRRLEWRRYEMLEDGRSWVIVLIPAHELVLASVEGSDEVSIPESIQAVLIREVTGVKKYEPEALARASLPLGEGGSSR